MPRLAPWAVAHLAQLLHGLLSVCSLHAAESMYQTDGHRPPPRQLLDVIWDPSSFRLGGARRRGARHRTTLAVFRRCRGRAAVAHHSSMGHEVVRNQTVGAHTPGPGYGSRPYLKLTHLRGPTHLAQSHHLMLGARRPECEALDHRGWPLRHLGKPKWPDHRRVKALVKQARLCRCQPGFPTFDLTSSARGHFLGMAQLCRCTAHQPWTAHHYGELAVLQGLLHSGQLLSPLLLGLVSKNDSAITRTIIACNPEQTRRSQN